MQFTSNTASTRPKRLMAVRLIAVALFALIFSYPKPAHAQIGCSLLAEVGIFFGSDDFELSCVNSVGHMAKAATKWIKGWVEQQQAQMQADAQKEYLKQMADAKRTVDSYVASDLSTTCATTMALQSRSVMQSFSDTFAANAVGMVSSRGTGPNADEKSINAAGERICEVADFICPGSQRYGGLAPQITCPTNPPCPNPAFADADINPESILAPKQLILPANIGRGQDGHIIINAASDNDRAYKAAWEVCENLALMSPSPPHTTGRITSQFIDLIAKERPLALLTQGSASKCFEFLARRTACPPQADSASGNNVQNVSALGNITSCYTAQQSACHRLADPPPKGLGLANSMDSNANAAMAGCDANGMSAEMYDYIYSHRCLGASSYVTQTFPAQYQGETLITEQQLAICQKEASEYERWLEKDKAALKRSIRDLALLRARMNASGSLGGSSGAQNVNTMPVQ